MSGTIRIAIVVGNTNTRLAVLSGLEVLHASEAMATVSVTADRIALALRGIYGAWKATEAVLCSVVPVAGGAVRLACRDVGIPLQIVRAADVRGMRIPYEPPDALGADRVCGILGLRALHGWPAMLVDCGTATTVNVLDGHGNFAGGCIYPGIATMLRALNTNTALLPFAEPPTEVPAFLALNTRDAVLSGAFWSAAHALRGMTAGMRSVYGSGMPVVITGGGAAVLLRHFGGDVIEDSHILFKGAAVYAGAMER